MGAVRRRRRSRVREGSVYRRLAGLYERVGESAQALRALKTYRAYGAIEVTNS